jgi:hypothetical protein
MQVPGGGGYLATANRGEPNRPSLFNRGEPNRPSLFNWSPSSHGRYPAPSTLKHQLASPLPSKRSLKAAAEARVR